MTDTPTSKRNPARASVEEAIQALTKAGVSPYDIRYDRRNDVVFAMKTESHDLSVHEQGEWEKPPGS